MAGETITCFLEAVRDWASAQPDIAAVGLVGSHAHGTATPASDVDLVILVDEPARYLQDLWWMHRFGTVAHAAAEDYGKVTSLRVRYADGREVEYGITDAGWAALPLDSGTQRVITDGLRILFEREPVLRLAEQAAWPQPEREAQIDSAPGSAST